MKYQKLVMDEEGIKIDEDKLSDVTEMWGRHIGVRICDEYKNKGFYLSQAYDWVMGKDSNDKLCLVPLVKEKT